MRCKFCSAPLPKKGLICNYCGQRNPLNLNVLSKVEFEEKNTEYNCPVCDITFDNINIGLKQRVIIQRCNDCDGIFITEDILEQMIHKQKIDKEKMDFNILRFIQNNPRQQRETIIRYRKCPVCDQIMQRINYRSVSGVIVDRCLRHGIWLDGGELKQLFEWKSVGGKQKTEVKRKVFVKKTIYNESSKSSYFDPLGNFFNWIQGG